VPGGVELRLVQRGDDFAILLEGTALMSTLVSASEEALATMTLARLGQMHGQQWLIGGYGMGYTLRAALAGLVETPALRWPRSCLPSSHGRAGRCGP
jgi:hypothetical protein